MKKSVKFNGIAKINREGFIIVDEGSRDYKVETPIKRKDLLFLENRCVEIRVKIMGHTE